MRLHFSTFNSYVIHVATQGELSTIIYRGIWKKSSEKQLAVAIKMLKVKSDNNSIALSLINVKF